jgi:phosphoglycerate dehydrogenase-like enzyme
VGRGSVIDQDAAPAEHPLWRHPRARLTPHVASNYTALRQGLINKIANDLDRYMRGESPSDIVDIVAGY